jgi:hypothetical protein
MDLVDIGSARLDPKTNTVLVQAKSAQIGSSEEDAPGFDGAPLFGSLGVTAVPWPKDDRGNAQALVEEGVPGHNGVVTNARDARAAGVVQELGPGETAIHSTGPDFDSVVFLKKQLLALMVGDDMAFVMDRESQKVTLTAFGCVLELSSAQGVTITSGGGATVQLFGPIASVMGTVVLGGRIPTFQLPYLTVPNVPLVGTPGPQGANVATPAPGVFIGV